MSQMPLALGGLGAPDFDRFWAGNDHLLLARLRALADHPGTSQVLLGGAPSSGKTHLLMACCDAARAAGHSAAYLPLARLQLDSPGEPLDAELVAIDDVGLALGNHALAEWLFAEINRQHDRQRALLLALGSEHDLSAALLPDLSSRLARSEMLRIAPGTRMRGATGAIGDECLLVDGDLSVDDWAMQPGDYQVASPIGSHAEIASESGAVLFVRSAA